MGQVSDPGAKFVSVYGLTFATVHMSFSLPRATLRGGLPVVQHRVTRLAEVTFLHVNRTQKLPGARVVLRMLIIKGELQRENKLISYERAFKMLENDTYIAGIGQAVLELLNFKVGSGNHPKESPYFRNFRASSVI